MGNLPLKLKNPPIVEALLDIDCDMPPGQDLRSLEASARETFRNSYPKFRGVFMQEHRIETNPKAPSVSVVESGLHALQFLHTDEKQLVQIRAQGYSFNRLAPYTTLDDYTSEMEWTWNAFVRIAKPVSIRLVRLRYINQLSLPLLQDSLKLEDYLLTYPQLPEGANLEFTGFFNQHAAAETGTENQANIILATQPSTISHVPIILDISAISAVKNIEPGDWNRIALKINELRGLKNRIFWNTLTEKCINLFQM